MLPTLLLLALLSQPAPHIAKPMGIRRPPAAVMGPVLSTKGRKPLHAVPPCVHGPNPAEVLRLARYEARVAIGKTTYSITRKAVYSPSTAWKQRCTHFLKVGFPLTETIPQGQHDAFFFASPPRGRSPLTLERFHRERFKEGNTVTVKGFLGAALKLPPLSGNPSDHRMIFTLEQRDLPLPSPGEDKLRAISLPVSQYGNFALHPGFVFKVNLQLMEPWNFQGGTLPDEKRLENRVSWEMKRLPRGDVQLLFSDFAIVDEQPGVQKARPDEISLTVLILTIAGMTVFSAGILVFLYLRKRRRKA